MNYTIVRPTTVRNLKDLEYELILALGLHFSNEILHDEFDNIIKVNNKVVRKVNMLPDGSYDVTINNNIETPFDIYHNYKLVSILLNVAIFHFQNNNGILVSASCQTPTIDGIRMIADVRLENDDRIISLPYINPTVSMIDLIFRLCGQCILLHDIDAEITRMEKESGK